MNARAAFGGTLTLSLQSLMEAWSVSSSTKQDGLELRLQAVYLPKACA